MGVQDALTPLGCGMSTASRGCYPLIPCTTRASQTPSCLLILFETDMCNMFRAQHHAGVGDAPIHDVAAVSFNVTMCHVGVYDSLYD